MKVQKNMLNITSGILQKDLYYVLWNVVIYLTASLMLYFVANETMDMAQYFIIVPYLTSCTVKLITLFDKTRALVSECKILMIYELLEYVPQSFHSKIVNFLKNNESDKVIIVLTHSDDSDEIADLEYVV